MNTTLPNNPPVSKDIPIISSRGGSEQAYKDPNSPESIIKKTKTMEVQAVEDSKFDVNVPAHDTKEGYQNSYSNLINRKKICPKWIYVLIIMFIFLFRKDLDKYFYVVLGIIGGILILCSIATKTT